jgi:hypothetical protein
VGGRCAGRRTGPATSGRDAADRPADRCAS